MKTGRLRCGGYKISICKLHSVSFAILYLIYNLKAGILSSFSDVLRSCAPYCIPSFLQSHDFNLFLKGHIQKVVPLERISFDVRGVYLTLAGGSLLVSEMDEVPVGRPLLEIGNKL